MHWRSSFVHRRRVLPVSLVGAALDYLLMALAPGLGGLHLGRVLAGITGADMAMASARWARPSVSDSSPGPCWAACRANGC
ncbi:hypothetical protein A9976_10265 [Delftia sp. UME58]|nr:hypothetical protein [Delftia sp. UME58]